MDWHALVAAVAGARTVAAQHAAEDALSRALLAEAALHIADGEDREERTQDAVLRFIEALAEDGVSLRGWCRRVAAEDAPHAAVRAALRRAIGRRQAERDARQRSVEDKLRRVVQAHPDDFLVHRNGKVSAAAPRAPAAPIPWPPDPSDAGGSFRHAPDAVYLAWLKHILVSDGPSEIPALARRISPPWAPVSLDAEPPDGGLSLSEALTDDTDPENRLQLHFEYRRTLDELSPTDNRILRRWVEEGISIADLAREQGVTAHHVRQLTEGRRPRGRRGGAGHG